MSEVRDGIVSLWPCWHPSDTWASTTFQSWVFWYPLMHTLSSVNCYHFHIILSTWVSPSKDKDLFCTLAHEFTQHRCTALWNSNTCPALAAAFFPRLIFSLSWGCVPPNICQALALSLTCSSIAFSESPRSFNTLLWRAQGVNSHRASPPFLFWCSYCVFVEMCPHLKVTDVFSVIWASPWAVFAALLLRWVTYSKLVTDIILWGTDWGPLLSGRTSSCANPVAEKPVLLKLPY